MFQNKFNKKLRYHKHITRQLSTHYIGGI